ncbi:hypothetical protein JO375_04490 [Paenibacillus sp. UY79]|nr:hypothetical protein [Paenibacillus farraposensis]
MPSRVCRLLYCYYDLIPYSRYARWKASRRTLPSAHIGLPLPIVRQARATSRMQWIPR